MQYSKMRKRGYHKYLYLWQKDSDDFRQLRLELSADGRLKPGRLAEIERQTAIPVRILKDWRTKLLANPEWAPKYGRPGPHVLTAEQEENVLRSIQEEYLDTQRLCTRQVVAHKLTAEGRTVHGADFVAGRALVSGFLQRQGLSYRKPHLKRRSDPDDDSVGDFIQRIEMVFHQFPPSLIINVDETCWRLFNGPIRTVAPTGADSVHVISKATMKTDITVIAACTAAGDRLPLWLVTEGKGKLCEQKFRNSVKLRHAIDRKLFVDHSVSGWSTRDVMLRYLKWLKKHVEGRLVHVVWDLYSSHRDTQVVDFAASQDIGLTFIPAGQTGEWQPLDRRIFGSLKQRAAAILNSMMIDDSLEQLTIVDAIAILVQAWDQVTEEEIVKAWHPLIAPIPSMETESNSE